MLRRGPARVTVESGRVVGEHDDSIYDLALSADSTCVLSVGRDAALCLWNLATGALERRWQLDAPASALSAESGLAATWTRAGTVVVVSTDAQEPAAAWQSPAPETVLLIAGGETLLTGGGDGVVRWWDVQTAREVRSVEVNPGG